MMQATCRQRRSRAAMVLPALIMLVMVLVILSSVLVMNGTASLRTVRRGLDGEQAYLAAEAGIVQIAAKFARGQGIDKGQQIYRGELKGTDWTYEVTATVNTDGTKAQKTVDGISIPPQTTYLRSVGISPDGELRRVVGALFTQGAGTFQAGVLAESVVAPAGGSHFYAYDSTIDVVPNAASMASLSQAILASRKAAGAGSPQFDFASDTRVEGDVYLAPGTTAAPSQIVGVSSVLGVVGTLGKPIDLPTIKVPRVKRGVSGEEDGDAQDEWSDGYVERLVAEGGGLAGVAVYWDAAKAQWKVVHNGRVFGSIGPEGGNVVMSAAGAVRQGRAGNDFEPHDIKFTGDRFEITDPTGNVKGDKGALPARALSSVNNASELSAGAYNKVAVEDGGTTELEAGGVFVMKDLEIEAGGQLKLAKDVATTIYVTGDLKIEGENAIANTTKVPSNLKIYYTGKGKDITFAGGSEAYFSLIAPDSNLHLIGPEAPTTPSDPPIDPPADPQADPSPSVDPTPTPTPSADPTPTAPTPTTSFYGALIAKKVSVTRANFYYDVATGGIGQGTDVNTFYLINEHRI